MLEHIERKGFFLKEPMTTPSERRQPRSSFGPARREPVRSPHPEPKPNWISMLLSAERHTLLPGLDGTKMWVWFCWPVGEKSGQVYKAESDEILARLRFPQYLEYVAAAKGEEVRNGSETKNGVLPGGSGHHFHPGESSNSFCVDSSNTLTHKHGSGQLVHKGKSFSRDHSPLSRDCESDRSFYEQF